MERLRVIYLTEPHIAQDHIVAAVGTKHDLRIYDPGLELVPQFGDVDAVIDSGGSVGTRAMLDAAPRVRLWQIMGSGFEHFDVRRWTARGVLVANCPGSASAPALAERAMLFMLSLSHRLDEARSNLDRGVLYDPMATELSGRRLGLVGLGASAVALSSLARAFGMRIAAVDIRAIPDDEAARLGLEWHGGPERLDELVASSDVVSLHVHLDETTRGIIDARRLALMPPGALLINVARGALVDDVALGDSIANGHLGGAGLDVFEPEPPPPGSRLLELPNVIATPHTAGHTDGTIHRRARFCAANLDRIAEGLAPESLLS